MMKITKKIEFYSDLFFLNNEIKIEVPIMVTIIIRDQLIGNFPPNASFSQAIFNPTNTRTIPSPYFR